MRPNDHAELKSHGRLLDDMCKFYGGASHVMKHAVSSIDRIEAELEGFRDD
jgi:hypothetical protein